MPILWQISLVIAACVASFSDAQVVGFLQSDCANQECNPRLTLLLTASIAQADDAATYVVPAGVYLVKAAFIGMLQGISIQLSAGGAGTVFEDEQARSWEILPNVTLDLAPVINGGPEALPSNTGVFQSQAILSLNAWHCWATRMLC